MAWRAAAAGRRACQASWQAEPGSGAAPSRAAQPGCSGAHLTEGRKRAMCHMGSSTSTSSALRAQGLGGKREQAQRGSGHAPHGLVHLHQLRAAGMGGRMGGEVVGDRRQAEAE